MTDKMDLSKLSREDLIALMEAKEAKEERLSGITIKFESGIAAKSGKPWDCVLIRGGVFHKLFGWQGLKLKPDVWEKLKELTPDIEEELAVGYPE